jgi:hypothetical protein
MAGCLDAGGVGWLRTAAWLLELKDFGPPRTIEVLARCGTGPGRTGLATVHRTTSLPADDITTVRDIPVTSVARTLLGLCSLVPDQMTVDRLVDVVEDAQRRRLASTRWLWWFLEERRCRGRNGVSVMEQVLIERDRVGPTESWLERELLRVVDVAGLPRPELQAVMRRKGAFVSRVDFRYPRERVIVEVEGKGHRTRTQHSRDAEQRNVLQTMGWIVLTFTYDQLVREPEHVARMIARALTR